MEDAKQGQKSHVLVVPFPAQGHINPMLQFSKRLAFKGIKPTLTPTVYIAKSMQTTTIPTHYGPPIQIRPISDGYDDGGFSQAESTKAYLDNLRTNGSKTLAQLIQKLTEEGDSVKAVIYDGFLPWVLDVAKQFGLVGVVFFTQSCSVNSIYYHVQRGLIQLPLLGPGPSTVSVPGVPELQLWEVPSFVGQYGSYPFWFDVVLEQFSNIDQVDWVLCNIFYEMEKEVSDWMAKMWKVRTIGPTVPSYYLDKRLEDDRDYSLQLLKPNTALCKNWLDTKTKESVIYVSFGSMADLSEQQFEELAWGLKNSHKSFLWVVRESEQAKLPKGFVEEASGQGLVVGWASQLEVLAHEATGCFVTHCGFNSVLEALCLGVPVVGVPQWTDQGTNAKFVEDVWGVGIRAKVDEKGIVRRKEVEECIRKVMEGEKKEELGKNVAKWKKLAKEAMDEGGNSDENIDEFVAYLVGC
ncbi:UDP-glycosyltransferase 74G1 [Beta vulgaris subsp. vulgaris]|uniref:UDP-glycosyltransferase 74G1 n=1 Tax=Beta vulgaris subsp. vulgaris TaxID=3555 RepID=UPI00203738D0|nr:UDP-glycosyltransferase 74G1 [Beta vulgaris subsp. vulgaris]